MPSNHTTEKIIGSLVNVSGHTFDMRYDLFFTTERVIAVVIQHPIDTLQSTSPWRYMFLGTGWSAGREKLKRERRAKEKRHSLQSMTPDELVGTNPRNLAIHYSDVASVELKRRLFQWQLRFHVSGPSKKERVVNFNLSKKQLPEAKRLLEMASLSEAS